MLTLRYPRAFVAWCAAWVIAVVALYLTTGH